MARYHHLPIYKLTYDLMNKTAKVVKDFPRDHKFLLGKKLQEELLEAIVLVYRANSASEKQPHITTLLERLQVIELLVRLGTDTKIIPKSDYAAMIDMTTSITKQAHGWLKSFSPSRG